METAITPDSLEVFAGLVVKAIQNGQWAVVVALAIVAGVWGVRKVLGPKYPVLESGRAGAILNLVGSFGSGLAVAAAGAPFSWAMVLSVVLSLMTSGGWSLVRNLLFGRGEAPAAITAAQKEGLAAAVVAKTPKAEDIANGP